MKKVVFLSSVHAYDDTRILHKEARSLAQFGYDVTHLCPHSKDTLDKFPSGETEVSGIKIRFYSSKSGWLARSFSFFRTIGAARRQNADIYHCNEPESWFSACFLKMFFRPGIKVIFDVHEHYPSRFDEPHIPGIVGLIGKPILRASFALLPYVTDHIILAKRSIAGDFSKFKDKCTYIFNFSPRYILNKEEDCGDPFGEWKKAGNVIFIHVGNFSRSRGWPQILEAMARAKNRNVVLVGMGKVVEGESVLLERAEALGVRDRVDILAPVPYEDMFRYLNNADVGVMLYQPGIINHVFAFPMKLYDYMAASIPVIGPDFALEVVPVIEDSECGHLVDTSDPAELAVLLDWFCENPAERLEMGKRGREAVATKYVWDNEAEKLLTIYQGLS